MSRLHVDLEPLRMSFDHVPQDAYLDGGHRGRALARYTWDAGTLARLPERPFFQSADINPVAGLGGVERAYPSIMPDVDELPAFKALVAEWLGRIGTRSTTFSVHQIRTRAGGDPAPEGPHRDGYEYIGIFVVDRCNVGEDSALTDVWEIDGQRPLVSSSPLAPGVLVTLDDRRVLHDVTPVTAADPALDCHRDTLILTTPDHGFVAEHGEIPRHATA